MKYDPVELSHRILDCGKNTSGELLLELSSIFVCKIVIDHTEPRYECLSVIGGDKQSEKVSGTDGNWWW